MTDSYAHFSDAQLADLRKRIAVDISIPAAVKVVPGEPFHSGEILLATCPDVRNHRINGGCTLRSSRPST
jgi:hypothetical protein